MAKQRIRKILKFILWSIIALLLLFAIVWGLLQLPTVQNWATRQITNSLSKTLDTEVKVDRVNLKFFKTAQLQGIFVADQQGDTLLYAGSLGVNVGLFDFFQREIFLNDIDLEDAYINLHNTPGDSTFNYQFLIEAFAADATKTPVVDTSAKGWAYGLDEIDLKNTKVIFDDQFLQSKINADVGRFKIGIDGFDLDKPSFDLGSALLDNSRVQIIMYAPPSTLNNGILFPDLGVNISLEKLDITQSSVSYHNNYYEPLDDQFDPNHLDLENINIEAKSIELNKENISFELNGRLKERDGLIIEKIDTRFSMSPTEMNIPKFIFETSSSEVAADVILTYPSFDALGDFINQVNIDAVLQNSRISGSDLNYLAPILNDSPLVIGDREEVFLTGKLSGKVSNLQTQSLALRVGNKINTVVSGSISGLPDINKLKTNLTIQNIETSYEDLQSLTTGLTIPEAIKQWGRIKVKGKITGGLERLVGVGVNVSTEGVSKFDGDFVLENLNDMESFKFDTDVIGLTTNADELRGFSTTPLPPQLDSLGVFSLSGKFKGTTTQFSLNGKLNSEAGALDTDLFIDFNEDYTDASYKGWIGMENFDLGRVLADQENIGALSLDIETDGKGLQFEDIEANLKGLIKSVEYLGYTYKDFYVDGRLVKQKFLGVAGIEDENINMDFDGQVDISGDAPDFIFTARVDTINLHALNLMTDTLGFSGIVRANFIGQNVDDMEGFIHLDEPHLTNVEGSFATDRISVFSNKISSNEREFALQSDLMRAVISGDYKLLNLPKVMINFVNDYFPLNELISEVDRPDSLALDVGEPVKVDEQFTFEIYFSDPTPLTKLYLPSLTRLDTGYIKGALDTKAKSLQLNAYAPNVEYAGTVIDSIRLRSKGDLANMMNDLKFHQLNISPALQIPEATAILEFENDSAHFSFVVKDDTLTAAQNNSRSRKILPDTLVEKFGWAGSAGYSNEAYHLKMNSPLLLNGEEWNIDPANDVSYASNDFTIHRLNLYKPGQEILISTIEKDESDDISPIEIGFRQFRLEEISKLLDREAESFYDGRANGNILIRNVSTDLSFLADIVLEELTLNQEPVGTAFVSASQENAEKIDLEVDLMGPKNDVHFEGSYNIDDATMDMIADVKALELKVIDPFLLTLVHDSEGVIVGNLDITGPAISPDIEGNVTFENASTVVDFLNIRYRLPDHQLIIKDKQVRFGQMTLFDPNDNEALLSGDISYVTLDNILFNLNFQTDRFQIINTTSKENELFYGDIFVQGTAEIRGNAEKPIVNVIARTLDQTQFSVQPLVYDIGLTTEDFIIFANPNIYQEDTTMTINDAYRLSSIGVDLNANIEITQDAILEIIIDPATGDKLVCQGNADLVVEMNPLGDLSILGNYTLTSGEYTFVFQGVLKKKFDIEPGSTVTFIGDPLESKFNIKAIYSVRAPTYPLIAPESVNLSESEIRSASRKTNIEVQMDMRGDLTEPEILFDIVIPDDDGSGAVSGTVTTKLQQLRDNESDLNKQVFGLLLFNGFISTQSNTQDQAFANIGLSTVSSLLTNQLNTLAKKLIKGVDLDFSFDSYKSGFENETVTEFGVGASESLFDDRLTMRVGGNVNNSSVQDLNLGGQGNSSFSGDFILEYKLTPEGDYKLRFSQLVSSEKNVFNPGANYTETGVAIFFTKLFNSKKYALKLNETQKKSGE